MKKFTRLILFCATLASTPVFSQQAVTSAGGGASGSGGSASYSMGQISYTTISGSGGTATLGVQQPFEISVLGTDQHHHISLNAVVYPNPTVTSVVLRIESESTDGFRYELYDLNGRLLGKDKVLSVETPIAMDRFPSATYILKVYDRKSELKSFKILKNN